MARELMGPEEKITLETYEQNAAHWAKENYHATLWAEDVTALGKYLPRGKILEIGAGNGADARRLIAAGYEYLGTDASSAQVAEAKRLHPDVTFLQRNAYGLDFPAGSFDGFWAAAVLLHIPRAKIGMALEQIHRVVKPGGVGFVSLKEGRGQQLTEEPASDGIVYKRLFTYYSEDEFRKILSEYHFDVISVTTHKLRPDLTWLKFIVRRLP